VAVAPLSKEKQILVLNGGGVSPKMVGISPYMFHNRSLAADLAAAIVNRAKARGFNRMAQIAIKDEFGDSTIAATDEAWKKAGREMVAAEQFTNDAANIDTQVAKLRAAKPDVIADWPTSPQSGMVVKRLREMGMNQPVEAMEWTPDDSKLAGKYAEGVEVVTDYFAPTADNPWGQHFFDAYKAKYHDEPDFYAANYYEAVYIIAEVIRRAKAKGGDYWNGAKLTEALRDNPSFDSVYGGKLTFKPNGVALKRVGLLRVENGQLKFQGLIDTQ
jgi:branched-chain amino acid transport system substrate-binding protein